MNLYTAAQLPGFNELCQRWRDRTPKWRRRFEGGFDRDRYTVAPIEEAPARAFTEQHHYSASWPASRLRYALYDQQEGGELVGVAVLGIPMHPTVLTRPFPKLRAYEQSLELSRLVLLDSVPGNGESFFCARAFRHAAEAYGIRGIVAHSDPVPRIRINPDGSTEKVMPGHLGGVYQALGFVYLGRTTARTLIQLPDGSVLTARAAAKVTGRERGDQGVIKRLVALGADRPGRHTDRRTWLADALNAVGATRIRHRGNHRYAKPVAPHLGERRRLVVAGIALPYPKHIDSGPPVAA